MIDYLKDAIDNSDRLYEENRNYFVNMDSDEEEYEVKVFSNDLELG